MAGSSIHSLGVLQLLNLGTLANFSVTMFASFGTTPLRPLNLPPNGPSAHGR
jgi:hypothetical protein